jgi:hypothetical protein
VKREINSPLIFVCPVPLAWVRVHGLLRNAWEQDGRQGTPPPTPLILGGWFHTNDVEKARRWRETCTWATENGYTHLIPDFAREEQYQVVAMSSYDIGPLGGPMYLPWSFDPKEKPSDAAVSLAMEKLREQWASIAGPTLAPITRPLRFTGIKKRRLVVLADGSTKPPWGEWHYLAPGERRRTFMALRQAVNDAIAPMMVDHIDFETSWEDKDQ